MLVVVGGHSRNVGKTAVTAGPIAALPELNWTAVKITQYGHGLCSTDGEPCECAVVDAEHPYAVSEEVDRAGGTDTSRFLRAGAERSFWVRTAMGQLGHAIGGLRRILDPDKHCIVESNSILQFFKPDLYFVVVDFATEDFKPTSLRYLDRADALVVVNGDIEQPRWRGVAPRLWQPKRQFRVRPPQYVADAMVALVRGRINSSTTLASGETCASSACDVPASDK